MDKYKELYEIAKNKIKNDSSHDFLHSKRVANLCIKIQEKEGGDLDILVPAGLFHDVICYPKNSDKSTLSTEHSAELTYEVLSSIAWYPKEKIEAVLNCIKNCSFSKKTQPKTIEEAILQDADRIEAVGSIAIMRTFASAGTMNNKFYNEEDPFGKSRELNAKIYSVDLFPERLLIIPEYLNTQTAKEIAKPRMKVLNVFLESLKEELENLN